MRLQNSERQPRQKNTMATITKEALPSFFEDLHNLLWNKAGLNPERALEHMTFFFAYRLVEQQTETLNLPQVCRWSYIAGLTNENDLFEAIKKGVNAFRRMPVTKPFFKPHEIQKAELVFDIVQHVNRIPVSTLHETDTLGDIFEYMLGRGMSTMSDEGQYFTSRSICKMAFKLAYDVKKTLRRSDGTLCTFADWFCGTGGFPAEYVKGVREHLPDVDWKKDAASIYCQDMNLSSVTTTLLNMLILTGVPFGDKNIRSANSFSDRITLGACAPFPGLQVDYCFMNPPYGGDKTKGKDFRFVYAKKVKEADGSTHKRYFVNQEIQSIGIEDDDKVSAGVQLAMATLSDDGGVCCIVLPQGFFFGASKKCVELRKKLTEDYRIHTVVDIASGAFANTGTKTSMLVFQKGVGPTEKVSFIGLDETVLAEATLEEMRGNNYTFNYKQYVPQEVVEIEGFEMVKLGDVITISTGKNKTPDNKSGTLYPYYGTSGITGFTDNFLEDGEYILTARNGTIGNTFLIDGKTYPSDHMFVIRTNETCNLKFLFYWMLSNKNTFKTLANTTTIPGITKMSIKSIRIPLPSLAEQQRIVDAIDGYTQLAHQEEVAVKLLEKHMMLRVTMMGRGQPRVKLGEVCEFKRGKCLKKTDFICGPYPVVGGGIKAIGYHTAYNRESYTTLVSQSGTAGYVSRYPDKIWATDCFSIHNDSSALLEDYLYFVMKYELQPKIYEMKVGTCQPHVYPDSISHLTFPLPPLAEQQKLQSDFDEIRHKHKKIAEYKAKAQEAIEQFIPGAKRT
jgi:type I restriction enzyme, S subunit